jgi:hypothetical protein
MPLMIENNKNPERFRDNDFVKHENLFHKRRYTFHKQKTVFL